MWFGRACYNSKVNCEWLLPQFFGPTVAVLNARITPMTRWSYIMKSSQLYFFCLANLAITVNGLTMFFFFPWWSFSNISSQSDQDAGAESDKEDEDPGVVGIFPQSSESVDWCLREKIRELFLGKISWYPVRFPRNQSIDWSPEARRDGISIPSIPGNCKHLTRTLVFQSTNMFFFHWIYAENSDCVSENERCPFYGNVRRKMMILYQHSATWIVWYW